MKTVSIHDAKTNLSKYIAAAKQGEDIYIGSYGKPEVKLVVSSPPKPKRRLGVLKVKISGPAAAPDYDDHTDPDWQEIVKIMTEGPIFPNEKDPS